MLTHIFTTFYRSVLTRKFQLFTIVFGLTMAIVVGLLIYVYVKEETTYDKSHVDANRIYRVNTTLDMEGKVDRTAKAGLNTGEALMEFYPEIDGHTQLLNVNKQTIKIAADLHSSEKVIYADSSFFSFFTYPFLIGDPKFAMAGPNFAVISKSIADQYFGSAQNAFGSTMNVNGVDFQVNGIFEETGNRTHIPHEIFLSMSSLPKNFLDERDREFMWLTTYSYIRLKPDVKVDEFEPKFEAFNEKHLRPYATKNKVNGSITHHLEAVTNVHLDDKLRFDFPGASNPKYLSIFSAIAMLTLLIALINYINLTTAQVSKRLKEIGIKKSIGAAKFTLLLQFLSETIFTVTISFVLALLLLYYLLPELNRLTDKTFTLFQIINPSFIYSSLLFIIFFGIGAGIYPAMLLSSFKPIQALQATNKVTGKSLFQKIINPGFVRKMLVIAQFAISVFLIIATIIVFSQFRYMQKQNLGFSREQVMVIDIPNDTTVSNKIETIKNTLLQMSAVKSVSSASSIPGSGHGALTMNVSQSGGSEIKVINTYFTDEKFIETLKIELIDGRYFSKEYSTDPKQAFVINEAAAKFLGWADNPIDKKIVSPLGQEGTVVGVVKDFNYKSLHSVIEPLIIMNIPKSQGYLLIRLSTADLSQTIDNISESWREFDSAHPYEYFFLDEKFQAQYIKEERLVKIFTYFSALAISISCLGLIGLAVFTNELKIKEIAIRKTFGATTLQVLHLLSKDFMLLIILANVIAWPLSYYLVSNWLNDFAYKTPITILPFALGMIITFIVAFLTISYFANKAARQSIIGALRHD